MTDLVVNQAQAHSRRVTRFIHCSVFTNLGKVIGGTWDSHLQLEGSADSWRLCSGWRVFYSGCQHIVFREAGQTVALYTRQTNGR